MFIAGSPRDPLSIIEMNLKSGEKKVLQRSANLEIDEGYISEPEGIEFPTENGLTAYGFYYAPKNRDFDGPPNEKPLLLVKSHGGPTSAAVAIVMPTIQYWTSRGIAVLDVNYGGSTGYGRAYRERLRPWGIVMLTIGERREVLPDAETSMRSNGDRRRQCRRLHPCALTFRDYFKAAPVITGHDLEALESTLTNLNRVTP